MQVQGFTRAVAPAQSDSANQTFGFTPKAMYVGGAAAGDVKVKTLGGDDVTFDAVQPGTVLPIAIKRVFDTGTTVADADMLVLGD